MVSHKIKILLPTILLIHTVFIYIDDGSGIGRKIQAISLALLGIYLISKIKSIFRYSTFRDINTYLLIYSLCIAISSYLSQFIEINEIMNNIQKQALGNRYKPSDWTLGLLFSLSVIEAFILIEWIIIQNHTQLFLKYFLVYLGILLLINDFIAFYKINTFSPFGYILGNKFTTSYLHINILAIFLIYKNLFRRHMSNTWIYCGLFYCAFYSIYTECTTALLGCIILLILFIFKKRLIKFIFSPIMIICILFFFSFFLLISSIILQNEFIQQILYAFGEDATLTGRTDIYKIIGLAISAIPFWGVGPSNSIYFFSYAFRMPNPQNGLMDILINYGYLSTFTFIILLFQIIKFSKEKTYKIISFPIVSIITAYIILASVEITLDTNFITLFPFILFGIKRGKSLKVKYNK